jgi:hypothetical protein
MLVREFIETYCNATRITFLKARARKDANTPFYHAEYQETPLYLLNDDNGLMDYIVLNDSQPPIDWLSGASWQNNFKNRSLESLLVISEEDFKTLYPNEEQRAGMITYIDEKIKERRSTK